MTCAIVQVEDELAAAGGSLALVGQVCVLLLQLLAQVSALWLKQSV